MTKSGPRNFYIYSPYGRTGGTRLRTLLLNNTEHADPAPEARRAFTLNPPLPTEGVILSHIVEEIPKQYEPILSTRHNKAHIIMSNYIARKANEFIPKEGNTLTPFSIPVEEFIGHIKQALLKERKFLNKHSNAITIYLEDTVEDIQQKLQVPIVDTSADTAFISNYPPEQYIENYKELQDAFSDAFPDA